MRSSALYAGLLLLSTSLICTAQIAKPDANQPRLQEAGRALAAGNLDRAESELQSALHSAPGEYRALDLLGVVRVLQKRETEAEELFHQTIQKQPAFAPGHAHLGLLYLQLGRTEEAVPELREALRLDPTRADAAAALVRILQDQARAAAAHGDAKASLALLADARKYAPGNADIHYEFGVAALQMSLWQDAISALQQTLKLRKNDAPALYNLGRAFLGLWKLEDARRQFSQYIAVRPDDASGYCALGMTLAALERSEEARAQFERSVALDPAQTESYFRLGLLELEARDLDSADKNLRQVLDRDPRHPGALTATGRVEFSRKHYDEALIFLQRAIANGDSTHEVHYYLGLTLARLGRKQESDEQLQIATQMQRAEAEHRSMVFTLGPTAGAPERTEPSAPQ
jgi:tetratricopeptide (TPR) repeat protein